MRPWLFQFGPILLPTDARDELNALATGLETQEFVDKVWAQRVAESPSHKRPRSRSWPKSIRTKDGYILREHGSNVTPIRKRGAR